MSTRSNTFCISVMVFLAGLSIAPAQAVDKMNPDQAASVSRQMAVPAGPNSVVNTASGKLITTIPITGFKCRGKLSVDFTLTKVSDEGALWWETRPAWGWRHSYQSWVAEFKYNNVKSFYQWNSPDGSYGWDRIGSVITRRPGNPYDLVIITGGFQVVAKDGTVYEFKRVPALGYTYLTAIRDTRGGEIALTYDTSGHNLVNRVTDASSGRYLQLNWKIFPGYGSVPVRLESVEAKNPNGSTSRKYSCSYLAEVILPNRDDTWHFVSTLAKITMPDPITGLPGAASPYYSFTYTHGYGAGWAIETIKARKNNNVTGDDTWTYTYSTDSLARVTKVTGPNSDEGKAASIRFDYPWDKFINGYSYQLCRVLDSLYTGKLMANGVFSEPNPADRQHREVHLYSNHTKKLDDTYPDGFFECFGPSIAYVIGSQSTDDPNSGSTYDLPITAAFPKCYYSKYTWNSAAPEFDGTLSSYTPPTATDSSKRYTYKWHSDSATATDNRLNLWKITNPKNVITTMTYNVPPAANTSNKIEVGDSVYVKVTKLEFPVIDGTFTVGSDGRISMKASWGSTYTPYVKDLTTDQAATAIVNAINYPIQRLIPGNYTITVKLTKFVPQAGTHNCLLTSTTDAMNHRTTYEYNGCNELWKTYTDPSGLNLVTVTTYDGYGNVCSTTDPYGKQTTIDYDTTYHCFPIKQTEAATNLFTESGGYDMFGNAGWSNAPRTSSGSVLQTTYTYDKAGQLTKLTNPDTTTVQYTYDTNGNNLTVTDPNGKVATYHYDNFGHINWDKANARVGTIDKDVTTSYCFDELGRHKWTKTVRAGASKQITSYYDERSRLIKETLPGSKPELYKYTYDGTGNILAKKSGHSTIIDQTLSFEYDELGRALKDKCGATILADRTYTADGLLSKIANATGENVEYTYDNAHRELTCYQAYPNKTVECVYMRPPTKTVTVKIYNGRGNTGSLLGTYTHEYDSDWRPTALTSPADVTNSKTIKTTYSYDSAYGLLSKVVYNTNAAPSSTSPGCPYTSLSYDTTTHKRLWLTTVGNYHSDGSKISTFAYLYDNAGNRTTMTEADGACTNYAYDNSYNLLSEERKTSSSGSQVYKYDYQYDEAGNRTVKVLTNSLGTKNYNYTYSDNNILTAITGAATGTFSYDYQGNQVERNITSAGGSHWYYAYDPDNHLTSIGTSSGGTQIGTFRYDVLGRRVGRTDKGRKFVYYGNSLIAETNATMNSIVAWYTPGICESRLEGTSWNTYYYHCDAEGTTREVTDSLQRITDAYAYNAWGEDLGQLRPSTDPAKPTNPLRYVGKSGYYTDTDTGLMLLGARYYDPLIGRFITQDPDKDGLNWYEYADNNPVMNIDPTGTVSLSAAAHGVLGVAGFIPVIGTVTDILDAGVYAIEGDYTSAGVALVACVPIVGDGVKVAATAGKALKFAAKHGDEIAKAGAKIAKAGKAANVADRMKLAMGLALKEATESPGLIMAKGHSIHDIARLLKRGGKADDWAKMTAPAHKLPNGTKIQYHWYENLNTGKRYDMKMKDVTPKFPKTR